MANYRTFVMAGRMMTLVTDENRVDVIVGRRATEEELNTEEYDPRYLPMREFVHCYRESA